jgi:hypothetical protein
MNHSASVEERVRVLEKHNRSLRWTVLLTLVLSLLGLMWGRVWPRNGVVEAREFVVTDSAGRARGSFGVGHDGAGVHLYDAEDRWRIGLLVDPTGRPALFLFDTASQPVATFNLQETGAPFLRLRDPERGSMLYLRVGGGRPEGVFLRTAADSVDRPASPPAAP